MPLLYTALTRDEVQYIEVQRSLGFDCWPGLSARTLAPVWFFFTLPKPGLAKIVLEEGKRV